MIRDCPPLCSIVFADCHAHDFRFWNELTINTRQLLFLTKARKDLILHNTKQDPKRNTPSVLSSMAASFHLTETRNLITTTKESLDSSKMLSQNMASMNTSLRRRQARQTILGELQQQLSLLQENQTFLIQDLQQTRKSADQLAIQAQELTRHAASCCEVRRARQTVYHLPPVPVESSLHQSSSTPEEVQGQRVSLSPEKKNEQTNRNDVSPLPSISIMMDPILFIHPAKRGREEDCSVTMGCTTFEDDGDNDGTHLSSAASDDHISICCSSASSVGTSSSHTVSSRHESRKRRREQDSTVRKKWRRMHRDHRLKSILLD